MPWVGFEPMIPVFERAKTVHAFDRAATVIGKYRHQLYLFSRSCVYIHSATSQQHKEELHNMYSNLHQGVPVWPNGVLVWSNGVLMWPNQGGRNERTCSSHEGDEKWAQNFGRKTCRSLQLYKTNVTYSPANHELRTPTNHLLTPQNTIT
jgi:hypothetical protein